MLENLIDDSANMGQNLLRMNSWQTRDPVVVLCHDKMAEQCLDAVRVGSEQFHAAKPFCQRRDHGIKLVLGGKPIFDQKLHELDRLARGMNCFQIAGNEGLGDCGRDLLGRNCETCVLGVLRHENFRYRITGLDDGIEFWLETFGVDPATAGGPVLDFIDALSAFSDQGLADLQRVSARQQPAVEKAVIAAVEFGPVQGQNLVEGWGSRRIHECPDLLDGVTDQPS